MVPEYAISHVEIHLTNRCNVVPPCSYCTYDEVDRNLTLPLDPVTGFLQTADPSVLMLVGGGEPTVYSYQGNGFNDAVQSIRGVTHRTEIRVVTNGISIVQLAEASVDSVGVSLGGAYYYGVSSGRPKGDKLYWRVLKNLKLLISRSEIPHVSASFVYHKENLDDLLAVVQDLYECVGTEPRLKEKRFCFFPLACADDHTSDVYHESNLSRAQMEYYHGQLDALARSGSSTLGDFIEANTKIRTPLAHQRTLREIHCGMAANYVLLAADGNLYPCCVAAAKRQASLGPVGVSADELYDKRRLLWEHAPAEFCQWCRIKNTYMGRLAWDIWQ